MIFKFKLTSLLLTRTVAMPVAGIANTQKDTFGGEGGHIRRITDKSKDDVGALVETVNDTHYATTTLAKNTVSMMGLMESCEAEITGMQDVVSDLRDIVGSIDNMLLEFDTIGSGMRSIAKQERIIR